MRRKKGSHRSKDTEELLKKISQLQQKISELESENQSMTQKAVEMNKSID